MFSSSFGGSHSVISVARDSEGTNFLIFTFFDSMPSCEDDFMICSTRQIKFPSKSELNGNKVRKSDERKKSQKEKMLSEVEKI